MATAAVTYECNALPYGEMRSVTDIRVKWASARWAAEIKGRWLSRFKEGMTPLGENGNNNNSYSSCGWRGCSMTSLNNDKADESWPQRNKGNRQITPAVDIHETCSCMYSVISYDVTR